MGKTLSSQVCVQSGKMATTPVPSRFSFSSALRWLRPSHEHTPLSATLLLMTAVMLSRVVGFLRETYISNTFGADPQTDAFFAAFTIPDWLNYLVAGGTVSITFISIFTRYVSEKREAEAQKAFSVIITVMTAVLGVGIVLTEIFTPQILHHYLHSFKPEQLALCSYLTRILLPAQVFFYVGGVVSAVLLSRRLFLLPALGGIFYNVFIILGGVLLHRQLGIASLAFGAVAGAVMGPFLINVIGARRTGMSYRPSFEISNPGFREWVWLSIPLMLGVSLVSADEWIMRYFAAGLAGDISRLNFAKKLFLVPIAVLGQASGQASLPFFARLFGEKKLREFAASVNNSVYRVAAASLLASSWMMAASLPFVDLVFRRGKFTWADSQQTAVFFFWFALSLALWSAQALYARAFYAAGNTLTPMVAGTIITAASLPIYAALFHSHLAVGLTIASDLGIAAHTVALAVLLNRKRLVRLSDMNWLELGKALFVSLIAAASYLAGKAVHLDGSRLADVKALVLISFTWAAAAFAGLWVTRSQLLSQLRRRVGP
ncbi:MAG: murein biosynthesis integral membrane protein MurJ [Acidobacteria bacterium]|nr:MAG: murein biosynthesis integral membrane protein MurJ [Acidobacteriota bacterium]